MKHKLILSGIGTILVAVVSPPDLAAGNFNASTGQTLMEFLR